MKNIINDQIYAAPGIAENRDSLPANQNSKQQDQLGLKNQKSLPLSLTPCFSPRKLSGQQCVEVTLINTLLQQGVTALPGPSTVSTVSFATQDLRFEISNLKSAFLSQPATFNIQPSTPFSPVISLYFTF